MEFLNFYNLFYSKVWLEILRLFLLLLLLNSSIFYNYYHIPSTHIVSQYLKELAYKKLEERAIKYEKVKSIVCIGQDTDNIHKAFKDHVDNIVDANSMNEAVGFSYQLAEKGDVVLLSPACASFDMFSNFEHRGTEFKKSVRSL